MCNIRHPHNPQVPFRRSSPSQVSPCCAEKVNISPQPSTWLRALTLSPPAVESWEAQSPWASSLLPACPIHVLRAVSILPSMIASL